MRVSQKYSLGVPQAALDFVDIDVSRDVRLFVDPGSLLPIGSPWAAECRSLLQHYFHTVLDAVRQGDKVLAR